MGGWEDVSFASLRKGFEVSRNQGFKAFFTREYLVFSLLFINLSLKI